MNLDRKYQREVGSQLMDPTKWPEFESPKFLDTLERAAERALARRTLDGNLAAILVYHQLAEELVRVLLADCRFFMRCAMLPARIEFNEPKKATFGQWGALLRSSVEFGGKEQFLKRVEELNEIRIGIAHKLTRRGSLVGIRREALRAQRLYLRAFKVFDRAHDFFRVVFNDLRKERCDG